MDTTSTEKQKTIEGVQISLGPKVSGVIDGINPEQVLNLLRKRQSVTAGTNVVVTNHVRYDRTEQMVDGWTWPVDLYWEVEIDGKFVNLQDDYWAY